jgi:hypothetical protein
MYGVKLFHTNLARMSQAPSPDRQDADIMLSLTRASARSKNRKDKVRNRRLAFQGFDLVEVLGNPKARLRWAK